MLGTEGFNQIKSALGKNELNGDDNDPNQPSQSVDGAGGEAKSGGQDACADHDYLITNLTLSRELGFIVGIATPDTAGGAGGRKARKPKRSTSTATSSSGAASAESSYLFTYNLKGNLVKSIEINKISAKEREHTIVQTTRDGEYILMTESCNSIKILRTFDLTPLYSFNTGDGGASNSFQIEKIHSLSLVDLKYLLVGVDNGKALVYNIDFNRWNHEYNSRF